MAPGHEPSLSPNLGGKVAVGLFILSLIAFVTETQFAQYVQSDLGYRQPIFIFYVVHSSFAIILPLHLAFLALTTKESAHTLWASLMLALRQHLTRSSPSTAQSAAFPTGRFIRFSLILTVGATLPGLLWFIAVTLAPVTDVTALWNTNAFFAYLLTVRLFKLKWEPRRLAAVILATLGAIAVVYGGSNANSDVPESSTTATPSSSRTPFIGDLLSIAASILYGLYQVLYKIYAALPNDPEILDDDVSTNGRYSRLPSVVDGAPDVIDGEEVRILSSESVVTHSPSFGLYPNMLTSAIGICTFALFWIPILFQRYFGISTFHFPSSWLQIFAIAGISLSGVIFNAGFMILLGVWGPIVTSVGSLMTIVLVFVSDAIFGDAVDSITIWGVVGCGSIIVAFGVLAYDMMKRRHLPDATHA